MLAAKKGQLELVTRHFRTSTRDCIKSVDVALMQAGIQQSEQLRIMLARTSGGASSRILASRIVYSPAFRFFSAERVDDTTKTAEKESKPVKATKKSFEELPVQYADISRAHVAIRDGVVRTECKRSHFISELVGANVYLKSEQRQFTGSFKERGARNALLQLIQKRGDEFKKTGAIAASAGNHALALAYHGKLLDVPVTVVMPTVAPLAKVDKCRVRTAYPMLLM